MEENKQAQEEVVVEKTEATKPAPIIIATVEGTTMGMAINLNPAGLIDQNVANTLIAKVEQMRIGDRTTCVLMYLKNGMIIAETAVAGSAENYNAELGGQAALSKCYEKLFQYLSFLVATATCTPDVLAKSTAPSKPAEAEPKEEVKEETKDAVPVN